MRQILVLTDFAPNQARSRENYYIRLAQELRKNDWTATFVFSGNPSREFENAITSVGSDYRVTRYPLTRDSYRKLIYSLRGRSFLAMSTAYISCFSPFILGIKKSLGIACWIANDHSSGTASPKGPIKRQLARLRGYYYGLHIDRILAVSEFVAWRQVEQSYLPASIVRVQYNGIELERFNDAYSTVRSPRPTNQLLYVGQLIPQKGILTLMKAMVLLNQRPEPIPLHLDILGKGPYENELRAFAEANGLTDVQFHGQVKDVASFYRQATAVVVPSEWAEAFGLVAAEAMACGACVISSDAGGLPEVIGREQHAGLLFRSGDAADLAEKLLHVLTDPVARQSYQKLARLRIEELFPMEKMVEGFVHHLIEVVSKSKRATRQLRFPVTK